MPEIDGPSLRQSINESHPTPTDRLSHLIHVAIPNSLSFAEINLVRQKVIPEGLSSQELHFLKNLDIETKDLTVEAIVEEITETIAAGQNGIRHAQLGQGFQSPWSEKEVILADTDQS